MNNQYCNYPLIIIVGPTAIGKTALSLKIAKMFDCEIISVDSMLVYKHMNIGTAKPSLIELKHTPHHLIDIISPEDQYDTARFIKDARNSIDSIIKLGKIPLLTGGTGLYLKGLLYGLFDSIPTDKKVRLSLQHKLQKEGRERLFNYLQEIDPKTAGRLHVNDIQRVTRALEVYEITGITWSRHLDLQHQQTKMPLFNNTLQIFLNRDRQILYDRINQRTEIMFDQGLIEEVEILRSKGYSSILPSMQSIGYKHANMYVDGNWDKNETIHFLKRDTRRYAKRQITWFSRQEYMQVINPEKTENIFSTIDKWTTKNKNKKV